jgi:small subunit ribosomal protein S27Ae
MKKIEFFKIEGNKINRIRKHCPKCGPAVFLAEHKNRFSCGKCGYTEFKSGVKKDPQIPKIDEKPLEQSTDMDKLDSAEDKVSIEESVPTVDETTKENQSDEKHFEEEDIKSDSQDSKDKIKDKSSEEST